LANATHLQFVKKSGHGSMKKYAFLKAANILPTPYFANKTENTRFANTFIGKTCFLALLAKCGKVLKNKKSRK